ncbi:Pre-mRNA-splicing factor slu-7 [Diplogelasinospora grovesii]|uniref:Pre-mRNA-splicing factor SLU7 n=1 Tax=Diplogelasinospora grovesii TaxID=303347 RepID=A0AAN6S8J6_9PEZI|nr:Pre-mRNA-splicing factor slu-7 [Diplogelasinospora grovesii]
MTPPRSPSPQPEKLPGPASRKGENQYMPYFISKQPFYVEQDETDSLAHQRSARPVVDKDEEKAKLAEKGRRAGPARTKWVKGACENCGAMGHKKKDCLERPRKLGAKVTGRDIQADRVALDDGNLSFDAKRDLYRGYDPKQYQEVIEEYNLLEEARREALLQEAIKNGKGGGKEGEVDAYEEGFKVPEDDPDMMGKDRAAIRRPMRIREDTAKYLISLDLDAAHYNPKKRTFDNKGALADKSAELYEQERFLRESGDAGEFEKATRYAWEAQEKMGDTVWHPQANPTAGLLLHRLENEERETKRRKRAEMLASQYGEQPTVPDALKVATESETYVEYDEVGLIKGAPKKEVRSKYDEDVFINNHTSVWGSWWSDFKWGYACCHSLIKNSYCTGETGRKAGKESEMWNK